MNSTNIIVTDLTGAKRREKLWVSGGFRDDYEISMGYFHHPMKYSHYINHPIHGYSWTIILYNGMIIPSFPTFHAGN